MAEEKPSGQMADPGRAKQNEAGQAPSGQTGVQVGRVDGQDIKSGVPQKGDEPQTTADDMKKEHNDAGKRPR